MEFTQCRGVLSTERPHSVVQALGSQMPPSNFFFLHLYLLMACVVGHPVPLKEITAAAITQPWAQRCVHLLM